MAGWEDMLGVCNWITPGRETPGVSDAHPAMTRLRRTSKKEI
jgi:hypothetical protein